MNLIIDSSDLSVERVRADVEHICKQIPSRLAGSENGKRMAEFSCAGLAAAGAQAQLHEIPGLVSFPRAGKLDILKPAGKTLIANTLGHSVPTSAQGVTAELVNVGPGGYADYVGKDVAGKIVLVELSYHPGRHEKQRIAAEYGALGCVMMNWGYADSKLLPYGSVKPAWGNPTPDTFRNEMTQLPCIGIARDDGLHLRELLTAGSVTVQLHADVDNVWRSIQMTTGEVAADGSDDFVVVGGHQDSWEGEQATDNAAGSACMIELARFFTKYRKHLRRGISFGLWTAHETGTMIGSTWYVDKNWDRLREHGIAYLQIDQPACFGTTRWGSVSNAELKQFQETIDAKLLGDRPRAWRRTVKIGDASFFGVGVPMFSGLGVFTAEELKASGNANLGWWHHSLENTVDKLDWDTMGLHLKMYAAYVWELCTAPIIPCTFTPVADEVIHRLGELLPAGASVGLESALASAQKLREQTLLFDQYATELNRKCVAKDEQAGAQAELVNTTIKRLSRLLLPMVGTVKGRYGHDPYSYTAQTTVLPSLYDVPKLAKLPETAERWMLETQLLRNRNSIVDTLSDAVLLIQDVLRAVK